MRGRSQCAIGGLVLGVLLVAAVLPARGAVRRRLNIHSNPPGALVYVDNQQIGTTPCSVDFIYYGTREIRLIKPGYETLTVNQPIPTPWYEVPGLDFVSEVLVPTKIRDNRTVTYNLAPQLIIPTQEVVDRANQLRQDTLQYPGVPPATSVPAASVPGPVTVPPSSAVAPPPLAPEPLPGINPPPASQPIVPQPVPLPPPGSAPALQPRP
ncbi:MAG TPA: PEGA domain-containing protein [Lacipirellulaceae bacterium]|nr:PEGA domain-containing protein [Lacipirellulaceae bacterium]